MRRILESINFLFLLSESAARPHVSTRNASSRSECDKIDRLDLSDQPLSPKFDALVTLTPVHQSARALFDDAVNVQGFVSGGAFPIFDGGLF